MVHGLKVSLAFGASEIKHELYKAIHMHIDTVGNTGRIVCRIRKYTDIVKSVQPHAHEVLGCTLTYNYIGTSNTVILLYSPLRFI